MNINGTSLHISSMIRSNLYKPSANFNNKVSATKVPTTTPNIMGTFVFDNVNTNFADKIKENVAASDTENNLGECPTCNERLYKDDSNDSTVSFQTARTIDPSVLEETVRAHESEHVRNDRAKIEDEGGKVLSQDVSISHSVCPDCGSKYVSGGLTKTTFEKPVPNQMSALQRKFQVGIEAPENIVDIVA